MAAGVFRQKPVGQSVLSDLSIRASHSDSSSYTALFSRTSYRTLTELVVGWLSATAAPGSTGLLRALPGPHAWGLVVRYARTVAEAEDIFQEAFIKVFAHIDELPKPESADSWVKSVVVRTAINYYTISNY